VKVEIKVSVCNVATVTNILNVPDIAIERGSDFTEYVGQFPQLTTIVGSFFMRNSGYEYQSILGELCDSCKQTNRALQRRVRQECILDLRYMFCIPVYWRDVLVEFGTIGSGSMPFQELASVEGFVARNPLYLEAVIRG
jgi:hypothetical protein